MAVFDKLNILRQIRFDDLYNDFLGLERQQQTLVMIGIGVVLLIVLSLPIGCVSSKISERENEYGNYLKMAAEFHGLQGEYARLKDSLDKVNKASETLGSDPLKQILYSLADEVGIERQKVTPKTISPVTTEVFTEVGKEVSIDNIRFDQAINLVDKLVKYAEAPVNVKKLTVKVDPKNRQLMKSLSFTVTTLQPNK